MNFPEQFYTDQLNAAPRKLVYFDVFRYQQFKEKAQLKTAAPKAKPVKPLPELLLLYEDLKVEMKEKTMNQRAKLLYIYYSVNREKTQELYERRFQNSFVEYVALVKAFLNTEDMEIVNRYIDGDQIPLCDEHRQLIWFMQNTDVHLQSLARFENGKIHVADKLRCFIISGIIKRHSDQGLSIPVCVETVDELCKISSEILSDSVATEQITGAYNALKPHQKRQVEQVYVAWIKQFLVY